MLGAHLRPPKFIAYVRNCQLPSVDEKKLFHYWQEVYGCICKSSLSMWCGWTSESLLAIEVLDFSHLLELIRTL